MNDEFQVPRDEPEGVDIEALMEGGFNLMISRRTDGRWHVARIHRNPRTRGRAESADGLTLEEALRALPGAFLPLKIITWVGLEISPDDFRTRLDWASEALTRLVKAGAPIEILKSHCVRGLVEGRDFKLTGELRRTEQRDGTIVFQWRKESA